MVFPSSLLPVTVSSHLELHDWYLVSEHGLNHLCYLWLSETFMDFESFNHFHGLNLQSLIQNLFANGFESLISIYWMIFCSAADLCAVCDFSLPNSRTVADLFLWIKWRLCKGRDILHQRCSCPEAGLVAIEGICHTTIASSKWGVGVHSLRELSIRNSTSWVSPQPGIWAWPRATSAPYDLWNTYGFWVISIYCLEFHSVADFYMLPLRL